MKKLTDSRGTGSNTIFVFMFDLSCHKIDLETRNWRQVIYLGVDLNEHSERTGK